MHEYSHKIYLRNEYNIDIDFIFIINIDFYSNQPLEHKVAQKLQQYCRDFANIAANSMLYGKLYNMYLKYFFFISDIKM